MNFNFLLTELILWGIAIFSGFIAREFYISKDGMLRVLIVSLFLCKIWVYGGAAVLYCFYEPDRTALIRLLVLNLPMLIVMVQLWGYIRTHNK